MEVVNTLDIDGTQWELQDVEARNNILNLQNKNEEITAKINNIEETRFKNLSGINTNMAASPKWVKISGLYSGYYYNNNVFIITSRRGEVIQLICPIDDNNLVSTPIAISLWSGINKINAIKFKNSDIYIYILGWNSLRVNQISGDKVEISIKEEVPPEDATDIKINEVQFK